MSGPYDIEDCGDFDREDLINILFEIHQHYEGDGCKFQELLKLRCKYIMALILSLK